MPFTLLSSIRTGCVGNNARTIRSTCLSSSEQVPQSPEPDYQFITESFPFCLSCCRVSVWLIWLICYKSPTGRSGVFSSGGVSNRILALKRSTEQNQSGELCYLYLMRRIKRRRSCIRMSVAGKKTPGVNMIGCSTIS